MKQTQFTDRAQAALREAQKAAEQLGHCYIGSEHLLLGLAREGTGQASRVLLGAGLTAEVVERMIRRSSGVPKRKENEMVSGLTPRLKQIIGLSQLDAAAQGQGYIATEHLLLGILRSESGLGFRILKEAGVKRENLYTQLGASYHVQQAQQARQARPEPKTDNRSFLAQFTRDLTHMAALGDLDPVLERDDELSRMIQILARRVKNNPALLGEAGVGKTAVVEGLAQRIVDGRVPQELLNRRILALDLTSMIAGTKYRGEFEERVRKMLREVQAQPDIILFLDEMHNIVGAGSAEGAIDAANILKPALSRGELQIIGATTRAEYRKHIEKDAALERRFQPVEVAEPKPEAAERILFGLRDKYERYHRLTITDEAVRAAVQLSARYLPERFLPDKAVDLIDEAAACVRIGHSENSRVEAEDIAALVSKWSGVPVKRLETEEKACLLGLEDELHRSIVGQEQAVHTLCRAVRRGRVGLKDPKRPTGCFLFLGPTGVGKTALCRALAKTLFGSEEALLRFDMSEYSEKHTVSRLVGSPPGYVGHEDGGQLTEAVRRRPYSVVLFDELEKAHADVWNLLLQVMEEGQLTDNQGRKTNFSDTLIVMTSNIGAERITGKGGTVGFRSEPSPQGGRSVEELRTAVMEDVCKIFRPEFLNRLDETLVFSQLSTQEMEDIARNMLRDIGARMEELGVGLDLTDEAVKLLAQKAYDPSYGARPLRRVIREQIENPAAELLLREPPRGARARVIAHGDELELSML